ncbi:hypothetical protein KEJ37_01890 [Candidatus Bathyarchaeota archaeon]|nr:hypothetical protein [Candidatus Bathyarchaeota archaeon]
MSNIKTLVQVEQFAKTEDGEDVVDKIVMVPPWNASEENPPRGWVGFNITVTRENKINHEIHGIILPADGDPNPKVVMRAVNETGLMILIWDNFDPYTWDSIKVYTATYLDRSRRVANFEFREIDDSRKYIFLFRGLKDETRDRPILISVKETWYEERIILDPFTSNVLVACSTATACVGVILIFKKDKIKRTWKSRSKIFHIEAQRS